MQGPFRFVHPAVCCVFVVLAAAGVKSVPNHPSLPGLRCLPCLSQVVPVLYFVLYQFHSSDTALREPPTVVLACRPSTFLTLVEYFIQFDEHVETFLL